MDDGLAMAMGIAYMTILGSRSRREQKPEDPAAIAAREAAKKAEEERREAIRRAEELRQREEMERSPRAYRRRMAKLSKIKGAHADGN